MPNTPILVTGASGNFGRRALELLLQRNEPRIIATTRSPDGLAEFAKRGVDVRKADFDDEGSLASAFRGAGRALLISTDALDVPGRRIRQHRAAIRALVEVGAKSVVYTSLPNADRSVVLLAPDHAATEAALAETALDFTVLRNNVYTDLLAFTLPGALASGKLVDAREDGEVAYVTRDDCVAAAVAALTDDAETGRRTLDVTGPESLSSAELAAIVTAVFGREVKHVSVPHDAVVAGMVAHGMPEPMARIYASFDLAVAKGELASVTDTVQRLTGRAPRSVREFLIENRDRIGAPT